MGQNMSERLGQIELYDDRLEKAFDEIERLRDQNEKLCEEYNNMALVATRLRAELAAERERCAKIAEELAQDYANGKDWAVAWSLGQSIAAAIRKGE